MAKRIENQLTYKKVISFTETQRLSFEKLKYDVNINEFVRIAVRNELKREWKNIREKKTKEKLPF